MTANTERGAGSRWTMIFWVAAALALLTPLVAMRFTDEVNWTTFDFAFAAGMLGSVGLGLELAFRRSRSPAYRLATALALAAGFLIVWITGAVGIVGSERDDANLLFLGVLIVALLGALVARFRSAGMAWAMIAAAVAQLLVPPVAWVVWPEARAVVLAPEVLGSTVVFTAMWLISAWLFRRAGRP
jgi:hypothetical protein